MIAMVVVGVGLIPVFIVWERFFAPVAIMPKRIIMNRAFLVAVGIDFFYNFSGFLKSLYLSSFVWELQTGKSITIYTKSRITLLWPLGILGSGCISTTP
jgi:hypothetical protein